MLYLSLVVMRCQPLRRALGANQFLEPSIIFME
ncbi:damage-inducible protein DinB, partial [Vibrio cholerae]|nr:damage-inducible protein DinB [Vibrio cholerae]